eukprot:365022-Chlamydomonas_euryale.AAC.9
MPRSCTSESGNRHLETSGHIGRASTASYPPPDGSTSKASSPPPDCSTGELGNPHLETSGPLGRASKASSPPPNCSTGESGKLAGRPSRREIGHGALAQRSLRPVMPAFDEFSFAVRLAARTLASNGSSSMVGGAV